MADEIMDWEDRLPAPPPPIDYDRTDTSVNSGTVPSGPQIDWNLENTGVQISPGVAWQRANKYHFALGASSPGLEQLFQSINDPQSENAVRQRASVADEIVNNANRGRIVRDLVLQGDTDTAEAVAQYPSLSASPDTILENGYASVLLKTAMSSDRGMALSQEAFDEDPNRAADLVSLANNVVARKEVFQRLLEDTEHRWRNSGWGVGTISDYAEQFVPFLSWYRLHNTVPETPETGYLPGTMLANRVSHLWSVPLDQAQEQAKAAIEQLYASNPMDAISFARALVSMSSSDQIMGNIGGLADVATVGPGAVRATTRFGRFLRDVSRSTTTRTTRIAETLDAAGDTGNASRLLAQEAAHDMNPAPRAYSELRGQTMSLHNPEEVIGTTSTALSREGSTRLERLMVTNRDRLEAMAGDTVEIPRVSEDVLAAGARNTEELFRLQYPQLGDRVIDVSPTTTATFRTDAESTRVLAPANTKTFPSGISTPEATATVPGRTPSTVTRTLTAANEERVGTRLGTEVVHERGPNTDLIAVKLGNAEGGLFKTADSAEVTARDMMGLKNYTIEQHGAGYYIQVTKAIDETAPSVRGLLEFETKNSDKTNQGFITAIRDRLFGPEARLPKSVMDLRKTAAYGVSGLEKRLGEVLKPIIALNRKERKDFVKFTNRQRDYIDPSTKERGRFNNTQGDFESEWLSVHGRLPTEKESAAYWTYVQLYDFDWTLRNMNIYRDKSRLGLEMFNIGKEGPQGVEGRFMNSIPWQSEQDANILLLRPDAEPKIVPMRLASTKETIEELGDKYKVVQVSPTGQKEVKKWIDERPGRQYTAEVPATVEQTGAAQHNDTFLERAMGRIGASASPESNVGVTAQRSPKITLGSPTGATVKGTELPSRPINYIVTSEWDSSKLPFKQIPRRPGGHVEYPNSGYYLSIPEVKSYQIGSKTVHSYTGDKHLYRFSTKAQADKFQERWQTAWGIMQTGDDAKLAAFLKKNFPDDLSVADFKREATGPSFVRSHNRSIWDEHKLADKYSLIREADSEHNPYRGQVNMQYAQERGEAIRTIQELGSQDNPVFKFIDAPTLDPLATIDRAVGHLVRGRYMDDLKVQNAERFISEFHDLLQPTLKEMRDDPVAALLNAEFRPGIKDQKVLSAARAFRRAAKEFMGTRTALDEYAHYYIQKAAESVIPGDKIESLWAAKAMNFSPTNLFKSFAFHPALGFFNPRQLVVQAMSAVNAVARSPLHGSKGAGVATALESLLVKDTPETISHLGNMLSRSGIMSAKDFSEAFNAYKRSGIWNVGKEVAYREAMEGSNMIPTKYGAFFREASPYFFNKGERFQRATAWFTSYMEWRAANPKAALTDKAIRDLISRADSLTVNMSRASKASWERGLGSIPFQFLSYKARLADQMLFGGNNKALTGAERARMLALYSALWGIPVAAGAALPIWPWHKAITQGLQERGVNVDDSAVTKFFMEGLPGLFSYYNSEGTQMNWGESFGPAGGSPLSDLLYGDKSIWEVAGGPTGSIFERTLANISPLAFALRKTISGDQESFPLAWGDIVGTASSISTANNLQKAYFAFHAGQYVSRSGVQIDGLTGFDALLIGTLGVRPQELSYMEAKLQSIRDRNTTLRQVYRNYNQELQLAFRAAQEDRDEDFDIHLRRAATIMNSSDLNPQEKSKLLSQALKNNQEMVDSIDSKFARQTPDQLDAFIRRLERKNR